MRHPDPRAMRVVSFFEALARSDIGRLNEIYVEDARFKDPFNDVQGLPAIEGVFDHMFDALDAPRFVVHEALVEGDRCVLTWDFLFRFKRFAAGTEQRVHGASWLEFAADGRIARHRDYWDAAEELYEKLPAVGALMRWLKRRARPAE